MTDVITFVFVGALASVASYLALRPSREGDVDNLYTGGFAFVLWNVWAFSAYTVEYNVGSGTAATGEYPYLAYVGFAMGILMLVGLLEEVFRRLGIAEDVRKELGF